MCFGCHCKNIDGVVVILSSTRLHSTCYLLFDLAFSELCFSSRKFKFFFRLFCLLIVFLQRSFVFMLKLLKCIPNDFIYLLNILLFIIDQINLKRIKIAEIFEINKRISFKPIRA